MGQWSYIQEGPATRFVIYDDCERLAMTYGQAGQEADARLMAAAPDMLAALEKVEDWLAGCSTRETMARMVSDAIAKAKGAGAVHNDCPHRFKHNEHMILVCQDCGVEGIV